MTSANSNSRRRPAWRTPLACALTLIGSLASTGALAQAAANRYFGTKLAAGDFDCDGIDDLVVGVPEQRDQGKVGSGVVEIHYGDGGIVYLSQTVLGRIPEVHVFYGDANGIVNVGQLYRQGPSNVAGNVGGTAAAGDRFGWALASANFNNFAGDDLVVGAIGDKPFGTTIAAGTFTYLNGHPSGDLRMLTQEWSQARAGVISDPSPDEYFGLALCPGDFDGDGMIDVAVGVPRESHNGFANAGAINIIESRNVLGLVEDEGRFITQ